MLFPSVNNQKSWLVFLLIGVISANLYFHFTFNGGGLKDRAAWLDSLFGKLLHPAQFIFHSAEQVSINGVASFHRLMNAEKENERLKAENERQGLSLAALKELKAENERLKSLLEFRQEEDLNLLAARVIARDVSLYFRTLEINRGRSDGVEDAMPVVSASGAVGKILSVGSASSSVLLITDVNSRLDSVVQRSRTRTIVGGSPDGDLRLRFLPRRYDIHEGDELVTSGLGGFFPAGFKIGSVLGIANDPNLVLEEAVLEPAVDFDSLEEVFVVKVGKH